MGLFIGNRLVSPVEYLKEEFVGITREISSQGVYQMPTENFTFSLPSDVTDVGVNALGYAFQRCTSLTSVDLSSLTTISSNGSLTSAFQNCANLTSADLSSLTTVSGSQGLYSAFQGCTRLTSVDLSSLTTVSGNYGLYSIFANCRSLTSVDLSSLTTVSGNGSLTSAFQGCIVITDIYFRALTTTSFGSYTNQFNTMMINTGSTVIHTIHFPSNMESTISGLTGYPLFGGTSGYVVLSFDLPATE